MTLLFGADSACYLGCIHTCLVLFGLIKMNSGLFPPMVRIFWAGVNTVIALWRATKQPNQDPAEEVVSVRSQTNSGMVRLNVNMNWPRSDPIAESTLRNVQLVRIVLLFAFQSLQSLV